MNDMRKMIGLIVICLLTLTSCEKEEVPECVCTYNTNGVSGTDEGANEFYSNDCSDEGKEVDPAYLLSREYGAWVHNVARKGVIKCN